ncbi:MAG: response regulator [Bacteroidales bacterium]|nr:response regulator [Bacteroidales bacterium]
MNTSPHILVIDDENHICESCDRIFSQAGYKVDTNINATNGFRQALLNPYDAIILDLNLVESDGMQLLYGIRKQKPIVPVVIITGYPSEASKRMSTTLGVSDYIIKPFTPAELLEPVQKAIAKDNIHLPGDKTVLTDASVYSEFHYFQSSWFQQQTDGTVRMGGYLPNLSNNVIKKIKLPTVGSFIYRGLPLAEVTLGNKLKQIIPSSVSGLVTGINDQLNYNPEMLETNNTKNCWIATVKPNQLEEDLLSSKARQILVLTDTRNEENEFFSYLDLNGYLTRFTNDFEEASYILNEGLIKVITMNARDFPEAGPRFVKKLSRRFPDVKIIVFNEPDENEETRYRKNKLFYYGVNPIKNKEIIDLLHCAFIDDTRIMLKNPQLSRFLPNTIHKISIVNRYSQRVTLYAYNNILQKIHGVGYLLTKELLGMAFPLDINYFRFHKSVDDPTEIQDMASEKERNDRIIILQTKDMGKIPGCIEKDVQEYTDRDSESKLQINISIQPGSSHEEEVEFDYQTTIALKDIIKSEMISK